MKAQYPLSMPCLNKRCLFASSFILFVILLTLSGCASRETPTNEVEIAPDRFVTLPSPASLGYVLSASQLIEANWQQKEGDKIIKYSKHLPVELEVTTNKIALAGFSSWGSRLLSLIYENNKLDTYVLPGLGNTLPQPQQVLFNLMLTLWPKEAWDAKLKPIGWQLKDQKQHRQLLNKQGKVIIDIRYDSPSPLDGKIYFNDKRLGYQIIITTLDYHQRP